MSSERRHSIVLAVVSAGCLTCLLVTPAVAADPGPPAAAAPDKAQAPKGETPPSPEPPKAEAPKPDTGTAPATAAAPEKEQTPKSEAAPPQLPKTEAAKPDTAAPAAAAAPTPPPPPVAAVLSKDEVQGLLGKQVMSSTGEDMGRIVDVVVDKNGDLRAAIIDFGGFLGVGSRKIAVDRSALSFDNDSKGKRVITELTRNQVKDAPEYKEGKPVVVLGAAGSQPMAPDDSAVQRE